MPTTLLIIYRILGVALFALAAAVIVEKYPTVRGRRCCPRAGMPQGSLHQP